MYVGSEKETDVKTANELESSDTCSMHLSCPDGENVDEATQMVFHKLRDGRLLCELFPHNQLIKITGVGYIPFEFSDTARKKLIEFLLNPKVVS